jgi:hypothetical protein
MSSDSRNISEIQFRIAMAKAAFSKEKIFPPGNLS